MKPETRKVESESEKPSFAKASEDKIGSESNAELTEEEKLVLNLLKEKSPVDLNELKGQTGLSNKKWDKAIKGLTRNGLAKVEKNDEGLWVSVA